MSLSPSVSNGSVTKSYSKIPKVLEVPKLILMQIESFERFKTDGIAEVFSEVSPIQDFTGNKFELYFEEHSFREPKYDLDECKRRESTYCASLYVKARLVTKETGVIKEQEIFMGDVPILSLIHI